MTPQSPRIVATLIWGALLTGPTVFLGVALYLVFGLRGGAGLGEQADAGVLVGFSLALAIVTVSLSWLWAIRMRIRSGPRRGAGALPPGPESDAVARLTVSSALCEGGAIFAVVVFLLTGHLVALASYAVCWLALAAHFPGDRHWAQLTGTPAAASPNRMIRG